MHPKFSLLILLLLFSVPVFSQVLLHESFDNTVFPPAGWVRKGVTPATGPGDSLWKRVSESNSPIAPTHTGTGMAMFEGTSLFPAGSVSSLVSPPLNLVSGTSYTLKFWMYRDGPPLFNADRIEIYYNNTPVPGGTQLAIIPRNYQQSPATGSKGWFQYSYNIAPVFSGTQSFYIIFNGMDASGGNMTIDDVELTGPTVVTCSYPVNFRLTKISTTTASVAWVAPLTGTPESYDWEIRTSGNAGSGNTGLVAGGNTSNTSIDFAGLTANTNYTAYVRSSCGGDKSVWSEPVDFKTACSINAIPFVENFDGVTAPALPGCFTVENANSGNTWTNTMVDKFSQDSYSAPNVMIFTMQSFAGGNDWLYTPALNLSAGVYYRVQFRYKNYTVNSYKHAIEVKVGEAPASNAMSGAAVYSNTNISTDVYQLASSSFTVPSSGTYYLGIHSISPAGAAFNASGIPVLLDNLSVDIGPDPNCGIATNIRADSIAYNSTTIKWQLPVSGTAVSYDWEVRTSGLPGSGFGGLTNSGNTTNPDSILLTGLSMGTSYKFYLRSRCASPSYGLWSDGISFITKTTVCASLTDINISEVKGTSFNAGWTLAAVTSPPVGFDWELRTSGTGGSGNTGLVNSGSSTDPFVTVTGLTPVTMYRFYVRARCVSGNSSAWLNVLVTTGITNDFCEDAVELTVDKGFNVNPVTCRLDLATPSQGLAASCALLSTANGTRVNPMKDAWFKITIPSTGNAIVQTYTSSISYTNFMMAAYSGTCGSLTETACDNDGVPDDIVSNNYYSYQSRLIFTGRQPGEIIFIRVLPDALNNSFGNFNVGEFAIGAFDTSASVRPAVSPGGNCFINPTVIFNSTNVINYFRWNPIFDSTGKIVAEISPHSGSGVISTNTNINQGATRLTTTGDVLLNRSLLITPQGQPFSSAQWPYVRIYFTREEMEQLKAAVPGADYQNLNIVRTKTLCSGTYSGIEKFMGISNIGRYGDDYYAEIITDSLQNFYIYHQTAVAPMCGSGADSATIISSLGTESGNSFQWYVNKGNGFTVLSNDSIYSGVTQKTMKIKNITTAMNGYKYRCQVSYRNFSSTVTLQLTNVWTGAVDNKWSNPANWSCLKVPDSTTDVYLNNGSVLIDFANAACRSIVVKKDAVLTVSPNSKLFIAH